MGMYGGPVTADATAAAAKAPRQAQPPPVATRPSEEAGPRCFGRHRRGHLRKDCPDKRAPHGRGLEGAGVESKLGAILEALRDLRLDTKPKN